MEEIYSKLDKETKIPKFIKVRQNFNQDSIIDLEEVLREKLNIFGIESHIKRGMTVAITAGSRGIKDIDLILRSIVKSVKDIGAKPVIVPCMGSHGGATASGQIKVLEELNITEGSIGAPVKSSLEVINIGTTKKGIPVYVDKYAFDSDAIIIANRIKPHTDFKGRF